MWKSSRFSYYRIFTSYAINAKWRKKYNFKKKCCWSNLFIDIIIERINKAAIKLTQHTQKHQLEIIELFKKKKEEYILQLTKNNLKENDFDLEWNQLQEFNHADNIRLNDCWTSIDNYFQKNYLQEEDNIRYPPEKNQVIVPKAIIWSFEYYLWEIFTLVLCTCCFILFIVALSHNLWFNQNQVGHAFRGSLLHNNNNDSWYSLYQSCDQEKHGKGYCQQLETFYYAGIFYVIIDGIACVLFGFVMIIIGVNCFKLNKIRYWLTIKSSRKVLFMSTFLHVVAFSLWANFVELTTNDTKCKASLPINIQHSVCTRDGAIIAIINMALLIALSFFYNFLSKKIEKAEKKSLDENFINIRDIN